MTLLRGGLNSGISEWGHMQVNVDFDFKGQKYNFIFLLKKSIIFVLLKY